MKTLRPLFTLSLFTLVGLFLSLSSAHAQQVRISGMQSVNFGQWASGGGVTANFDICTYRTAAPANYDITPSGTGTAGALTLTNGTDTLVYKVRFNDSTGTGGNTEIFANTAESFGNADTTDNTCSGGDTANVQVFIEAADLQALPAGGIYTGTLSLLMEP